MSKNTTTKNDRDDAAEFEDALQALESLVEQLETGQLPLAESLKHFEQGVKLARRCHHILEQAQLTLTQLSDLDDPSSVQALNGLLSADQSNERSS